jgi:hypothetical protein
VSSTLGGNEVNGIEAEKVSNMAEEEEEVPRTIPVIKTEPKVSCVPGVRVIHISYRVDPELPAPISVCPCETKPAL